MKTPTTQLTVDQYNVLPATVRKTVNGVQHVLINGAWHRVVWLPRK